MDLFERTTCYMLLQQKKNLTQLEERKTQREIRHSLEKLKKRRDGRGQKCQNFVTMKNEGKKEDSQKGVKLS